MVDIIGEDELNVPVLRKFLLCVRKCHRNNAFHNFMQGFYVLHCIYCIVARNRELFTDIEVNDMHYVCFTLIFKIVFF